MTQTSTKAFQFSQAISSCSYYPMRYHLRTPLILLLAAAVLALVAAALIPNRAIDDVRRSGWPDWQPLLMQAAGVSGLVATVVLWVVVTRRMTPA
jgi:hypothetical protein